MPLIYEHLVDSKSKHTNHNIIIKYTLVFFL